MGSINTIWKPEYWKICFEGKSKEERFEILSEIAKYQLEVLNNVEKIKLLNDK